jgi:Flp pilus assembly protein TadG
MTAHHHRRRGSAATEFALTLGVMTTMVFGLLELSHLQEIGISVSGVAHDAAATGAAVLETGLPATGGEIEAAAEARALAALAEVGVPCGGGCTANATWAPTGAWYTVTVEVVVPYSALTHVDFAPGNLRRTAIAVTQQQ